MLNNLVCPISSERVDSNVSRLTVFLNVVLMLAFLFTLHPAFVITVTIDYGLRAMGYNKYSPLCFIATVFVKFLSIRPKMVDKAPKIFASRLGFICAVMGVVFLMLDLTTASMAVIGFFAVLALLDSVFNFCVGCLIYHHLVFPFFKEA